MHIPILVGATVLIALLFDFINGFHDSANSIATVVATRVLRPFHAVLWAALFNFLAAIVLGTGVASSISKGYVDPGIVTPELVLAGLLGAIVWNLITWWLGLPSSSSHALIGGYAGAAIAKGGLDALVEGKWGSTIAFIALSPMIGMALSWLLMLIVHWVFRHTPPARSDKFFRRMQLVSSALFSCAHGTNDGQKTMGIITALLVAAKLQHGDQIQLWVIIAASIAIALGTMSGGWRIVRTMGSGLTRLKPRGGFCAETGAAISIFFPTFLGLPVSTTHAIAGAIAGVGSSHRRKAVRWGKAREIVGAWVLTIPCAAFVAAICYVIVRLFAPDA
ncbi:MAG TPA: inorganic phosphate transporter [Bryobacteraceae bacterium]|nr:inorganic phosphate transporter [Bryobacteraceae bacterium]